MTAHIDSGLRLIPFLQCHDQTDQRDNKRNQQEQRAGDAAEIAGRYYGDAFARLESCGTNFIDELHSKLLGAADDLANKIRNAM